LECKHKLAITRLKKVFNIRKAALAINRQLIKQPRARRFTPIEQLLHKNGKLLMEARNLPFKNLVGQGSTNSEAMAETQVNLAML